MEAPGLWGIVISGVLAVGSILGVILSGVGKKQDLEQQQVSDQFKRMLDEVNYWQNTAGATRDQWEKRWDRQMGRCRTITDRLVIALTVISAQSNNSADKAKADEALAEIRAHNTSDHGDPE